jgi:hypothetical protein
MKGPETAECFLTIYRICGYLAGNALTLPGRIGLPFGIYLTLVVACTIMYFLSWKNGLAPTDASVTQALLAATGASAIASFSWYVLAFNHSMIHIYYNLICAFFAFVPVATIFCTRLLIARYRLGSKCR